MSLGMDTSADSACVDPQACNWCNVLACGGSTRRVVPFKLHTDLDIRETQNAHSLAVWYHELPLAAWDFQYITFVTPVDTGRACRGHALAYKDWKGTWGSQS